MNSRLLLVVMLSLVLVCSVPAQDTIHVSEGWNISRALVTGTIPAVLCTDPPGIITTSFFGYIPGAGYATADTLEKGLGYWVKVSSDGIIIFNGTCGGGGVCSVPSVSYEGETYPTVAIGSQCWLAKNLNVGAMIDSLSLPTNNGVIEKKSLSSAHRGHTVRVYSSIR